MVRCPWQGIVARRHETIGMHIVICKTDLSRYRRFDAFKVTVFTSLHDPSTLIHYIMQLQGI